MKRIYKSMMALTAALLLIPAAKAQDPTSAYIQNSKYIWDPETGVSFTKYLKEKTPNADGEYTLHIESFATGKVEVDKTPKPSDIILVLDASGSMTSNKIYHPTMRFRMGTTAYNYSSGFGGATSSSAFWIRYPDNDTGALYLVNHHRGKVNGSTAYNDYWLSFVDGNGVTRYPYGTTVNDARPAEGAYAAQNTTIYSGQLYRCPTRMEVLKDAAINFIDLIKENNDTEVLPNLPAGGVGNQISIVAFRGDSKAPDQITNPFGGTGGDSTTKALIGFTSVDSDANVTTLKNTVNGIATGGNTPHDSGMRVAQLMIQNLENNFPAMDGPVQVRLKTVVFFTDGAPVISSSTGRSKTQVRINATDIAYDLKQNFHTKVFSIGFNPSNTTSEPDLQFLQHLSSNYEDGKTTDGLTFTGTQVPEDKRIYYMDAATSDMNAIFKFIAENVAGGTNTTGESLMAVDMVSSTFSLPKGVDASRVSIWTAQCLGYTDETFTDADGEVHNVLAFADSIPAKDRAAVKYWINDVVRNPDGTPVLDGGGKETYEWKEKTEDIDENIEAVVDTTNNTVHVTGFNYGDLWCGLDTEHSNEEQYDSADYATTYHEGYRGFKIIIEFPIVIKGDALGGPDEATNTTDSGLYQTDEDGNPSAALVKYPIPSLPVPVKLVIQKTGLNDGDSANFTVQRRLASDPNSEYEDFTTFVLTGGSTTPEVRIINLDPNYYYKVKESNWSWAYEQVSAAYYTTDPNDPNKKLTNPIVFDNTPKDDTPKHAEAKADNVMKSW